MNFLKKFTKRDLGFAVLTGLITGVIMWQIFEFLKISEIYNFPWASLIVVVPILWILGVLLGYFLGQWLEFFNQFGKFAAIGFTNAAVDFGIFNILIARTDYTEGLGFSAIKATSFCVALLSSYVWNKYWAFKSGNNQGGGQEFVKFFAVTILAFLVNVSIASLIVNYVHPILGMNPVRWGNVAIVIASAISLVFSFIGFKIAVFKK